MGNENWHNIRLRSLLKRTYGGGTPSRAISKFWNGDVPWATVKDFQDEIDRLDSTKEYISKEGLERSAANLVSCGIPVICMRMAIGRIASFSKEIAINQDLKALVPEENINIRFLIKLIQYKRTEFERLSVGTTVRGLSTKALLSIQFDLPKSQKEQRRIAEILDTMDEAIQKTEALIAKLKAMKQGLLHDLLTRGLDENGKFRDPKAHPEQFKDSPLGRIPREWEIYKMGEVAVKVQDGTHFSPKSTSGPYRYLTSKNIRFGYIDLSETNWISEKEHNSIYSRCDVKYGDILITKDGANTGNAAINPLNDPISLLSSIAFIRCDENALLSKYLIQYLLSANCQQRIKDIMSGNAITRLTLDKIKSFIIPVPGKTEQVRLSGILNGYDSRAVKEEQYLAKLKLQKKGLMHDLLTGKKRVNT